MQKKILNQGTGLFSKKSKTSDEEITNPKEILEQILDSKSKGTVIGISSPILGRGMVLTSVEDLILGGSPLIVLKPYDTSGNMLPETKIYLENINAVRAFSTRFENPFVSKFEDDQKSFWDDNLSISI
jgi:hypothetical protein